MKMDLESIPVRCQSCPGILFYLQTAEAINDARAEIMDAAAAHTAPEEAPKADEPPKAHIDRIARTLAQMPSEEVPEGMREAVTRYKYFMQKDARKRERKANFITKIIGKVVIREDTDPITEVFGKLDAKERSINNIIESLYTNCENGPQEASRYGLVGRTVIKCGSKQKHLAGSAYAEIQDSSPPAANQ